MPSHTLVTSDARFFGLDLKDLGRQLREPWEGASAWPVFSWLTPSVPVCVLRADGRDVLWANGQGAVVSKDSAAPNASDRPRFYAVEVPEDLVLRRNVRLPVMGAENRISALALESRTASPFAPDDLVWGMSAENAHSDMHVLVLASRKQLLAYQSTLGARIPQDVVPEQWAMGDGGRPIVLAGFGEPRRLAFIARWRRTGCTLLGSAAVIAVCIALTPSIQLKLRADQAHAAYTRLAQSAAPVVAKREALVKSADQLTALQQRLAERIEPLRLLDSLTRVMPDDTALQSFKLNGTKVMVAGLTANASTLMQLLGSQAGMRDVRAPSPATRLAGAEKESFVIEFVADPAHFGVRGGSLGAEASPSTRPVAVDQTGSAQPAALPATAPAAGMALQQGNVESAPVVSTAPTALAPLPVKRPPPAPGAASFGGTATFGGTAPKPASLAPAPAGKGSAS